MAQNPSWPCSSQTNQQFLILSSQHQLSSKAFTCPLVPKPVVSSFEPRRKERDLFTENLITPQKHRTTGERKTTPTSFSLRAKDSSDPQGSWRIMGTDFERWLLISGMGISCGKSAQATPTNVRYLQLDTFWGSNAYSVISSLGKGSPLLTMVGRRS